MGRLNFYVLWSLRDAPRQFIRYVALKKNCKSTRFHTENTFRLTGPHHLHSKRNRMCFQVHVPLPLPKQLVIFGLGEWKCSETVSVEVLVRADVEPQKIGTLSSAVRCVEETL